MYQKLAEERSALVRFALELQALLDRVKGKLRSGYSDSDFESSDDDDDNVEEWMKDIELFLREEQVLCFINFSPLPCSYPPDCRCLLVV